MVHPEMEAEKFLLKTILYLGTVVTGCYNGGRTIKPVEQVTQQAKPNETTITNQNSDIPYSNPVLIYGSSFGSFVRQLYLTNQYNLLLQFTSSSSIRAHGKDAVVKFYKEKFRLDFKLGKLTNMITYNDTIQLTYANASIMATRRKVVILCRLENDSVKLVLPSDLNKKMF